MPETRAFGLLGRQPPDYRDFPLALPSDVLLDLPLAVDLRDSGFSPKYVFDQGNLGCHDSETEVLTELGWQKWGDYGGSSLLGTINPTSGALEFQAPTDVQRYEYTGPMHTINHASLDFSLTPNHRLWLRPWDERQRTLASTYQFVTVDRIGWYAGLMASPTGFVGTELRQLEIGGWAYQGDDLLALIALIVSDGWVGGSEHTWNRLSFCCFREDRREVVAALAARVGFSEIPGRRGVWLKSDAALADWMRANAFVGGDTYRSPWKRVPDLVKVASVRQIGLFLDFFGDKHVAANRQFYSTSRRMIDDLQELLLRVGKRSGIYERQRRSATMPGGRVIQSENPDITLTEWSGDKLSIERKQQMAIKDYEGEVFCATVPNGLLVTRRNGTVLISGNSCTANAANAVAQFVERKHGDPDWDRLSRLWTYYYSREKIGTVNEDSGAFIRDAFAVLAEKGAPRETFWPYRETLFRDDPSIIATEASAPEHMAIEYRAIPEGSEQGMQACLAEGYPFAYGFAVYESFWEISSNGTWSGMRGGIEGYHAVCAWGYDFNPGAFGFLNGGWIVRNSWSDEWGDEGYFYVPRAYMSVEAFDMWTIRKMKR